tara:strand:- start:6 stop:497 length:492 start_codon:yes stop_codon:yes gene_type:complete
MFHKNLSYAIHSRTDNNLERISKELNIGRRYLGRLRSGQKKISQKHYSKVYSLAKYLDIHPAHLMLMRFPDFVEMYQDPELKTYIDVEDNFIFNIKLIINNHPDKQTLINRLARKYQKAEYSEYYRKKVYRKIQGITNYNLNDVFIFSDVLKYDPALLLFGVQ